MVNRGVQGWSVAQHEVVVVYFVHKTTLTLHKTSISEKNAFIAHNITFRIFVVDHSVQEWSTGFVIVFLFTFVAKNNLKNISNEKKGSF